MSVSLVSDVGGTNTRVALARDGVVDGDTIARFRNANYAGLAEIFAGFLSDRGDPDCTGACIAMAGPVQNQTGSLTNLGWVFSHHDLAAATGARVTSILNDLQAQGHAVSHLSPDSLVTLIDGPEVDPHHHDTKLVIGVGTGFNAVPVFQTDHGQYVPPCESGHTTFPVLSDDDISLARHVSHHHGFPGVEDVLSGRGIERVYGWASGTDARKSSQDIMAAIAAGVDETASRTATAFARGLGRVASDLALTHLPFGGIYIVGGMAAAMRPYLAAHGFAEAFRSKGRFSDFMDDFRVYGVDDDYAALTGCARHIDEVIAKQV